MQLRSTTTQRTYRYLRLSIVGAVMLLGVSLARVLLDGPLTSISAAFYSSGRGVFVGALFAIALALVALSGHSLEQALLDLAAMCAPLIAIVPTPVLTGDAPGYVADCPDPDVPCVPVGELAGMDNGMTAALAIGAVGVVAALVLAIVQRTLSVALASTILVAAVIVVAVGLWWTLGSDSFRTYGHLVATTTFFALIAAVALVSAIGGVGAWRGWYLAIAIAIVVVLVFVVTVVVLRLNGVDLVEETGVPLVFAGEVAALVLFALFWMLQTAENWREVDASLTA